MTALAYFNSLRELGGARRILEEEVRTTVARYGARRRVGETRRLFRDRTDFSEPVELTSRVSTDQVAEARRAARVPVRRPAQPRRLRAGDEHDLGGPRHPAPRAHAGAGAAEGACRVHPGDEPRGAFRRGPGTGGDPAQRPQASRPFALRAVPPLSRDLLPLGRGGQRHAVLAPAPSTAASPARWWPWRATSSRG